MTRSIRCALMLAGAMWLLSACQSAVVQEFPLTHLRAENMLDSGVRQYEEGNYKVAARNIQNALDAGLTSRSQARAHKYLAFIACVSGQQGQCREEFRQALTISPTLELKPEEAGHPTWGPVFRSVKTSMSPK
jgi:Tfp pilus assembly protein PilF